MLRFLHHIVWGPGTPVLFLAVGLFCSIRICFFQIFGFRRWWKNTVCSILRGGERGEKTAGFSPFQSACTALAATIGTGNISGVATALLAGGPGAIFWMWVSALLGMATAYAETELGIRYRRRGRNGDWLAGPMFYLEYGAKSSIGAFLYAAFCILASFGMGSMVQANAISEAMRFSFGVPALLTGVILSLTAGVILAGGAKRIVRTAERLVPFSAILYIAAALMIVFRFRENLPAAMRMIITDAFSFRSAAGGITGFGVSRCVRYGIARGVFSNEAGLGSLAVLNGGAEEGAPGLQGQWAIFEVFIDTIVCCTLTALAILCAAGTDPRSLTCNGAELTGTSFSRGFGPAGGQIVSLCTALFAFATIIAWYYMGKQSAAYLEEKTRLRLPALYPAGYLLAVFIGSLGQMEQVWTASDIFNGLMAIPNLAAVMILIRQVKRPPSDR